MSDVRDPALALPTLRNLSALPPLDSRSEKAIMGNDFHRIAWSGSNPPLTGNQTTHVSFEMGDPSHSATRDSAGATLTRGIDVVVSAALLVFLLPVLVVVALLVYVTDPGSILFAHERHGRHGRTFKCLKFRSMVCDADEQLHKLLARDPVAREEWLRDHKLRDDPRITRIGNFLRRSSLDELPQLFNVLRGDMSLVGPRPIVAAEVARYGRYIGHYYRIRPGITGLWQVSGRNNVSYRRRVALDVVYAKRKSATLNLHILVMTLPSVLKSKGAF